MRKHSYEILFAGHSVKYAFLSPSTRWLFYPFIQNTNTDSFDIVSNPKRMDEVRPFILPNSSERYVEYRSLLSLTALELLKYDCCIFHSVCFLWKNRVFLLTAPSGTGKSTQYFNWQRLFPKEITMISGDMPVLERRDDGSVWAHPSPWNGKENIFHILKGQVAGIVLLEQGNENRIAVLSARDAIVPFFKQFVGVPETEKQICSLTRQMDQILRNIPCYKMVNLGDDSSTILLREALMSLAEGGKP